MARHQRPLQPQRRSTSAPTDALEPYKSPRRKLLRFFEKSRDGWRAKCLEAKTTVKRLQNRVRFLETSKDRLRHRVRDLEADVKTLKHLLQEKDNELAHVKKKQTASALVVRPETQMLTQRIAGHTYSVGHVLWLVSLVLQSASSLRGAPRAMAISLGLLQLPYRAPAWSTGRLWLLRLGYYKLMRPKAQADDWAWIVDHTVQVGQEKCLVILGVRLHVLAEQKRPLNHEDVEPLLVLPMSPSNAERIVEQLKASVAQTGVPRQIVADHGSDVKAGIEAFCQTHPTTCFIYDVKHKTACVLKHELAGDAQWQTFTRLAAKSKHQVQQSALACLAPPNQRAKARYMNIDVLVRWGQKLLDVIDHPERLKDLCMNAEVLEAKLGWLRDFRAALAQWGELLEVIAVTETLIRQQGVYRGVHRELKARLSGVARSTRSRAVGASLVAFLAQESLQAQAGERLLGSSEVIESVFGKLKHMERDQAKSGFTGLVLSLAAMVSTTTAQVVHQALSTVTTQNVVTWCKQTLGASVQSKRRKAFTSQAKTEQKRDQLRAVG
jgi:hypothetical protein